MKRPSFRHTHVGYLRRDGDVWEILVRDRASAFVERLETCLDAELEMAAASVVDSYANSDIGFSWAVGLGGASSFVAIARVPTEVLSLPLEDRMRACLDMQRDLPDPDAEENLYQTDIVGSYCLIATTKQTPLWALRDRLGNVDVRMFPEAFGLLALLQTRCPEVFDPAAPGTLALNCSTSTMSAVVVQRGNPVLAHHCEIAHVLAHARSVDGQGSTAWKTPNPQELDTPSFQYLVLQVVQMLYALMVESGAQPTAIGRILVGGEAVDRHELLPALASSVEENVDVEPLVTAELVKALLKSTNAEHLRQIQAGIHAFAGTLALVAADVTPGTLAFSTDLAEPEPVRRGIVTAVRVAATRAVSGRVVPALLWALVLGALTLGGHSYAIRSRAASLAERLGREEQRAAEFAALKRQKDVVEARIAYVREGRQFLDEARAAQGDVVQFLDQVAEACPKSSAVLSIAYDADRGGATTIVARAANTAESEHLPLDLQRETLGRFSERLLQLGTFSGVQPFSDTIGDKDSAGNPIEVPTLRIDATFKATRGGAE